MSKSGIKGKKRLVLLDAHAILHRAYHALPDFATSKGEPTGALYGLSAMLLNIIEVLRPDYIVACYDVKGPTYRHEVYKEYKQGRKAAEDDLIAQMKRSRDIFTAMNIPIYDKEGFEADDILGAIVEQLKAGKNGVEGDPAELEIIIASGDMDTMQLVDGNHVKVYTLKKGLNDTIMYDEKAVRARFGFGPELIPDYKGLRGDASDNIVGVKGIGEKTATILITTFGSIENIYKELDAGHEEKFASAGIKERIVQLLRDNREEAEFSKMLATIRRDVPIKFELPEKTFRESVEPNKIGALWKDLEFRTLPQRLEKVLTGMTNGVEVKASEQKAIRPKESEEKVAGKKLRKNSNTHTLELPMSVSKDEVEKVGTALWLIQSNLTNPTIDDILQFAGTNEFEAARTGVMAELDKRDLRRVYDGIELPLIPVTHKMEQCGVKIDRAFLGELSKTYHFQAADLEKRIWKEAGTEFNINSPRQLGEVLFDRLGLKAKNMKKTAGGARSTRESELEKLRDLHPVVPLIFEYRELQKLLSTYIDAIPPLLDANNRLHTNFIPSGTTTGRMASQDPNLQNIPVKSELGKAIRRAFIAEQGFKLAAFDYSQMELRIAAFLSGDEKMVEIFRKGEDVHTAVASFVFKVPPAEVTPGMRRQAKVINFGIIYGMGVSALQRNLGSTREIAQNFLNEYFGNFKTLAEYLDRIKSETAARGYTETFFGRRRYFEGIDSKIPYIKAEAERMAINAPIQGTEADVIKLAMIRVDEYVKENSLESDVFPLLQVHDELVYEIRTEKAADIAPKIQSIMESVIDPKDSKGVVLETTSSVGDNWGELK